MYLSRMELDTRRRSTRSLMESRERIHGVVESAFPGERTRKLWRVDVLNEKTYLLILSEDRPDFTRAAQQYSSEEIGAWQTKDYSTLLDRIKGDTVWWFRLTANPTKSEAMNGSRGKVRACGKEPEQKQWLMDRAEKNGFYLQEDGFRIMESEWHSFRKGNDCDRTVMLKSVTYEGLLKVTDAEKFKCSLCSGIGRGKAYGMGMLTVVKP